jgi:hypothetical protein
MDKHNQLKKCYKSIITAIDSATIFSLLDSTFPEIKTTSSNGLLKVEGYSVPTSSEIDEVLTKHLEEIEIEVEEYISLIDSDLQKWIAINRLKTDFYFFEKNIHLPLRMNRVLTAANDGEYTIKKIVEHFYFNLAFEFGVNLQSSIEFNIIGATPKLRKNKPTKETELALNQNELMYLFIKLGAKNLFTKQDKTHLARGIESLSSFSANKTREKGETLKLSELENIKTILNSISALIDLDIKNVQSKV